MRWLNSPGGSVVSGPALAENASHDSSEGGIQPGSQRGTRQGAKWGDLSRRVISALVLLPVALLCIWLGGWAFLLLICSACVLLAYEWLAMCRCLPFDPLGVLFAIVIVTAALCAGLGFAGVGLLVVLAGTAAAIFRGGSGRRGDWSGRLGRHFHPGQRFDLAFGVPYLGLTAVALPWLRADPAVGLANTLFILAIVWASDVGAYVVGRLLGGPKLAPAISPGKTWSGAAGGLICGALGALAVATCLSARIFPSHITGSHAIVPGIVLGIISQAGDLLESAIKRHFGVKDSGRIIPGHGGLLDRLDALLAVAPVAALLALTVGRGVALWR